MTRLLAWQILRTSRDTPLRDVEAAAREAELEPRDRALLRRIVGTAVRRRGTLRALVRAFAKGKPDADIATWLHVGLVQLFFLDQVPDHAAVDTTVGGVRQTLGPKRAAYVNATLRHAIAMRVHEIAHDPRRDLPERALSVKEAVFADPAQHPLLWAEDALSMPVELTRRWLRRLGQERAFELARGALTEPDLSLRLVTRFQAEADAALAQLDANVRAGVHPSIRIAPAASTESIVRSPAFESGWLTVQGETALRAAELVEARTSERILDLCAAPGGKTAVLAESGARIVATDASSERLERVAGTLARLGCAQAVSIETLAAVEALPAASFDAVLVDAPCSNTGVLAQRPEARWRFGAASQRSLAGIQEALLETAAKHVRPDGRLVYATCSIEPEENQRRIAAFVASHPEFELEKEIDALPEPRGERGPVDGGYAARLRRSGT